jgi:transcriptional repressor of cell division inhibition gene dicB
MEQLIAHFGGQTRLAEKLDITPQHVNGWYRGRTKISMLQAFKIEKLTKGKFKASKLVDDEMKKYVK